LAMVSMIWQERSYPVTPDIAYASVVVLRVAIELIKSDFGC